jgi:bifunctional non-homologous end joining protein LigD
MNSAEELAQYLGARAAEVDAARLVPMLCEREEAAAQVLERPGYLFELKLDGVRIVADRRRDKVALFYRKQRDATKNYSEIAEALKTLADARFVLDGEIVAFDERGRPDFQRLGHRIQTDPKASRRAAAVPVVYVVFDVLAIGPYDLRGFPIEARKEILGRIIPPDGAANGLVRLHPTFDNGAALYRLCREHRLEGVVAKKLGSTYKPGERTVDWLKIKCEIDAEFVVIGWTEGESTRSRLGALDLGAYEGDRLVFRGRVGSGLDEATIDMLLERLLPIEVSRPVAEGKYSPKPKRHHCRPELVVSVRYGGFSLDPSGARFLRFPVYRGIRADVDPQDCTAAPEDGLDLPVSAELAPDSLGPPVSRPPPSADARTRRIHLTAAEQPILPDGTSKEALSRYFEEVAASLLRHAAGRVCSLHRADGTALWPPPRWTPKFVRTTTVRAGGREIRGFVVDSIDTLLFAVEAGAPSIQFGPFLEDRPETSDFVTLRLESADRSELARVASEVHALVEKVGLAAAVKVAARTSIDVVVGIGSAPAASGRPLGGLLALLAVGVDGSASPKVSVSAVETTFLPFAPCATIDGPTILAVPLGWDEIASLRVDSLDFAAAIERTRTSGVGDALDAVSDPSLDVGQATLAVANLVAERMGSLG